MKRISFIFIFFILNISYLLADDISLTIKAENTVIRGARTQLQYELRGADGGDISLNGKIEGFEVLFGPVPSSFSSFVSVNGKSQSDSYIVYTYTLLAQKEGTYTLPSATITVKGKKYTSKSQKVKVIAPDKNARPQRPGQQPDQIVAQSVGEVNPNDAFVRPIFSKTKVNEQEAVIVTYRLYTKLNIRDVDNVQFPEFEGFIVEDFESPRNRQIIQENYKGGVYYVVDIKSSLLFPQRSGKLTIPAGSVDMIFRVKSGQTIRQLGQTIELTQNARHTLKIASVDVDVSPLPEQGKPVLFSGAVGTFTFTPVLSATRVRANEAVSLKFNIEGTGNLKLMKNPSVKFPEEFETTDPRIDYSELFVSDDGLKGTRSVEYTFIPRSPGKYKIPPVEFNYFDVKSRTYKTVHSPEYEMIVDIDPNAGKNNSATSYGEVAVVKDTDIRYIKTDDFKFSNATNFFVGSLSNLLWYLIPLVLFVIASIVYRQQIKANANVTLIRTKRANKVAIKRLKLAAKYLKAQQKDPFYEEVLRAVWGYLSDKLTIPVGELSRENIELEMTKYGASQELIAQFISVLDTCEFARYAPSSDPNTAMDKLYNEAVDAIGGMEK